MIDGFMIATLSYMTAFVLVGQALFLWDEISKRHVLISFSIAGVLVAIALGSS